MDAYNLYIYIFAGVLMSSDVRGPSQESRQEVKTF